MRGPSSTITPSLDPPSRTPVPQICDARLFLLDAGEMAITSAARVRATYTRKDLIAPMYRFFLRMFSPNALYTSRFVFGLPRDLPASLFEPPSAYVWSLHLVDTMASLKFTPPSALIEFYIEFWMISMMSWSACSYQEVILVPCKEFF
ncbi:hypothetical protein HGRIS_011431 [Hohenbuehelia grisea]|uniref:Uncharacterized protein n=1 Tax=Hohenbuehelia grisea TaxID=104357 RepID=A0ABR3JX22_9AGAR